MNAAVVPLALALAGAPDAGGPADSYPLDGLVRAIAPTGPVRCPTVPLVVYGGTRVRYARPARVHPAFAARLELFEEVVVEVARAHFGRAPSSMNHAGTFSCRRIGGYPTLLSEHGIGNGIDVVGFAFPRLPRRQPAPADLPASLRRPFQVSLADWQADAKTPRARFLAALVRRLIARRDIFRVLLGPAYPGHKGHLHFDVSPYRVVSIWTGDDDQPPPP
jgi:hypothetical protein